MKKTNNNNKLAINVLPSSSSHIINTHTKSVFHTLQKKSIPWKRGDSSAITMSSCFKLSFVILFLCLLSSSFSSSASPLNSTYESETLRPQKEIQKLKLIRKQLQMINKPAVKTIQANPNSCFFLLYHVYWGSKQIYKQIKLDIFIFISSHNFFPTFYFILCFVSN